MQASEIMSAFDALEQSLEAQKNGAVPFTLFAPEVQARLEKFDETGVMHTLLQQDHTRCLFCTGVAC